MKKTKRTQIVSIVGIIAIAAVIGFGFTACGGDGDGGGGIRIEIGGDLIGTWVGDTANGTLVFTANSISSPTPNTKASTFVNDFVKASGVTFVFNWSKEENIVYDDISIFKGNEGISFDYTINGNKLEIEKLGIPPYSFSFTGTKQ